MFIYFLLLMMFTMSLCCPQMPTCEFFLRGMCGRDNCPYLHVSVGQDVKVCPDFVKGFCPRGEQVRVIIFNISTSQCTCTLGSCDSPGSPVAFTETRTSGSTPHVEYSQLAVSLVVIKPICFKLRHDCSEKCVRACRG